jgi:hypothetical protein
VRAWAARSVKRLGRHDTKSSGANCAGRVRSNPPPDFVNVGDQCALIAKAFRTLLRFSALGHKEEPISVHKRLICGCVRRNALRADRLPLPSG